jgi:hypothetical protein
MDKRFKRTIALILIAAFLTNEVSWADPCGFPTGSTLQVQSKFAPMDSELFHRGLIESSFGYVNEAINGNVGTFNRRITLNIPSMGGKEMNVILDFSSAAKYRENEALVVPCLIHDPGTRETWKYEIVVGSGSAMAGGERFYLRVPGTREDALDVEKDIPGEEPPAMTEDEAAQTTQAVFRERAPLGKLIGAKDIFVRKVTNVVNDYGLFAVSTLFMILFDQFFKVTALILNNLGLAEEERSFYGLIFNIHKDPDVDTGAVIFKSLLAVTQLVIAKKGIQYLAERERQASEGLRKTFAGYVMPFIEVFLGIILGSYLSNGMEVFMYREVVNTFSVNGYYENLADRTQDMLVGAGLAIIVVAVLKAVSVGIKKFRERKAAESAAQKAAPAEPLVQKKESVTEPARRVIKPPLQPVKKAPVVVQDIPAVRDISDERELAESLLDLVSSAALANKKVVLAFDSGLGGNSGRKAMALFDVLNELKNDPDFGDLIRNVVIVTAPAEKLDKRLFQYAGEGAEIFVFARDEGDIRSRIGNVGEKGRMHETYVDEKEIKEAGTVPDLAYPLPGMVVLALTRYLSRNSAVIPADLLEKLSLKIKEESGNTMTFIVLPSARRFGSENEMVKYFARLKNFLRSA